MLLSFRRWWFNGHINLALRLSTAVMLWLALAWTLDLFLLGLLSLLALPCVFISGIDQPSPGWGKRLAWSIPLLGGVALVFGALGAWWPPSLIPALLVAGVLLTTLSAFGELSGRTGLAALVMAAMSQVSAGVIPAWQFALGTTLAALWVVLFSDWWFRAQREYPLRQALSLSYRRLAVILASRLRWLEDPSLGARFDLPLAEQLALVRRYVAVAKSRNRLTPELYQAFVAAVDLQERLQAIPNPELSRALFAQPGVLPAYRLWVAVTSRRLRQVADHLMTVQPIGEDPRLADVEQQLLTALTPLQRGRFGSIAPYFVSNARRISRLAQRVAPLYRRPMIGQEPVMDHWQRWRQHLSWSSPIFRGAVRQGLLLATTMGIIQYFDLDKGYWALLSVLLVVRGGIVDTRQRAWQRIWGTLVGLGLAASALSLGLTGNWALALGLVLVPPTLSLIPVHHGYSCTLGTIILIMVFEYIAGQGMSVMPLRLLETVIGCAVVLLGYRYLWPQWQGGRQAELRRQAIGRLNHYLLLVLSVFEGQQVSSLSLARARRHTYEQGVALTSSFEQMRQEPSYSRHRDSAELIRLYKETQSHLNALAPAARRGTQLTEEQSQSAHRVLTGAVAALERALEGQGSGQWPESVEQERQRLYRLVEEGRVDRTGFVLYQLNLIAERYQQMLAIAARPAPDKH
ncbi:FUSC family protein [Ferrimonas sp. YFM]|uniref:FUSC family protein n=1 Tax=Ferrimonas sp. YFM TaxID=3028878 RepID=UPI002572560E|nr:FUSC family protein [Ferrimonas sp. YFM]BDY03618.1 membrane protein [Ferrimonas sp. YFM]